MKKILLVSFIFVLVNGSCSLSQNHEVGSHFNTEKLNNSEKEIAITDSKILFWWWSNKEVKKGIDADNPPKKDQYLELVKWEYDGEGEKTYPHKVDFVSEIQNNSFGEFEGNIKFSLSAKFSNYEEIYFRDEKDDSIKFQSQKVEQLPWLNKTIIFEEKIFLKANQTLKMEKKDFDLKPFLNKKINEAPICAVLFLVEVFDKSNKLITSREKEFSVLLGD